MPDSRKSIVIIPTISRMAILFKKLFEKFGFATYYRGSFYEQLNQVSYNSYLRSVSRFDSFIDAAIRSRYAEKVAGLFSLNPDLLLTKGKQLILKKYQGDFHFSFLVLNANHSEKAALLFPASRRLRRQLRNLLGINFEFFGTEMISTLGFFLVRLKLAFVTIAKAIGLILLLIYWRLSGASKLVKEIRGSILWLAGGAGEVSLDPKKLSLPLYLRELCESGGFNKGRFSVICPFLSSKEGWNERHSRSIPPLRHIRPGLSNHSFVQGLKDSFRLLLYLPAATIRSDERMELLSLLPHLFLKRAWLSNIPVQAIVLANSCAGSDHALVHAAREMDIPVVMVFYSSNSFYSKATGGSDFATVPSEYRIMLSDHFCVWTTVMKGCLAEIGYDAEKIYVVGPQMFAPAKKKEDQDTGRQDTIKVAVIEVAPLSKRALVKRGIGHGFYTTEYCLAFLSEAIEAIDHVFNDEALTILKMKRFVNFTVFDSKWCEQRKDYLQQFNGTVIELEPDTNPWLLVEEADIIISIPFSSISEAGSAAGKPAAFFDPTLQILPRIDDKIPLLSGKDQLHCWLKNIQKNRDVLKRANSQVLGAPVMSHVLKRILSISSRN